MILPDSKWLFYNASLFRVIVEKFTFSCILIPYQVNTLLHEKFIFHLVNEPFLLPCENETLTKSEISLGSHISQGHVYTEVLVGYF